MLGARTKVVAISSAHVSSVVLVTMRTSENKPNEKAEGLNMCVSLPSRDHLTYSFAINPTAIINNCR